MIADVLEILVAPKSGRILRGKLSAHRIGDAFQSIRAGLEARTLHKQIRSRDPSTSVVWSLWIGRFEKTVPWLLTNRFREVRYAFALVLEHSGYVAILGSNIGDVSALLSDARVSYEKLLALHADTTTEIDSLSTRSLRAARVGVMRSTQVGRHLETSLSRVGANQAAPFQVSLRQSELAWRISPGSGRVVLSGSRSDVAGLCSWFASTCDDIDKATEPSDFIRAFAHPVSLEDLPAEVVPTALQLDAAVVDDMIELGASLQRDEKPLTEAEIQNLRELIGQLWLTDLVQEQADKDSKTWRLRAGGVEVGHLITRSKKISLVSPELARVKVVEDGGATHSLNQVFNDGSQPLRLTFSDPSYGYAAGQLFRDHRLVASIPALLEVLSDGLPNDAAREKGERDGRFDTNSLFGFIIEHASAKDDYLVCDDLGTEWADFIGVSSAAHEITFYHCKGGRTDVGASDLHDIVSQATKNLGYLTATIAELEARRARWEGLWNQTGVRRLQRGASVDELIGAFERCVGAPQSARRVILVTSSLSKAALADAFADLGNGLLRPEASHVLWLLLIFVDQCRNIGAFPQIVCRP